MADKAYVLSEKDRDTLVDLLHAFRSGRLNAPVQSSETNLGLDSQAPEVYVAKAGGPSGIAAIDTVSNPPVVSWQDSAVYKIKYNTGTQEHELIPLGQKSVKVFNLGTVAATGWFPVARDKSGQWVTRGFL